MQFENSLTNDGTDAATTSLVGSSTETIIMDDDVYSKIYKFTTATAAHLKLDEKQFDLQDWPALTYSFWM